MKDKAVRKVVVDEKSFLDVETSIQGGLAWGRGLMRRWGGQADLK